MDIEDKLLEYDTFDSVDKINIRLTARDCINQLRAKVSELEADKKLLDDIQTMSDAEGVFKGSIRELMRKEFEAMSRKG